MPGRLIRIIGAVLFFALATAVTQLGGLVFLLALIVVRILRRSGTRTSIAVLAGIVFFLAAIPLLNRYLVPPLAALGGREPLPCEATAGVPTRLCRRFIAFSAATMCVPKPGP